MKLDSLKLSRKNPLSSGNDFASTRITSEIANLLKEKGIKFCKIDKINTFHELNAQQINEIMDISSDMMEKLGYV